MKVDSEKLQKIVQIVFVALAIAILMKMASTIYPIWSNDPAVKYKIARDQIKLLAGAMDELRFDCGAFPSENQGLQALFQKPQEFSCKDYSPDGYLSDNELLMDPWGQRFQYRTDSKTYEIFSYGADRQAGGEAYSRDLSSKD